MRSVRRSALLGLICAASMTAVAADIEPSLENRLEMLDWADPGRALQLMELAPAPRLHASPATGLLEVRGMIYADVHQDKDVDAIVSQLDPLARQGDAAATVAAHYVRAYSLYERDQYAAAQDELVRINPDRIAAANERFRVLILQGNTSLMLEQANAALAPLEQAFDLAQSMRDPPRSLHALLSLAKFSTKTGNLERASQRLLAARQLATSLRDEAAMADVEGCLSDIADRRGDHAAERAASLASLDHAMLSGSPKWIAHALVNLGDSYLKSRDYRKSLHYSMQALPMVAKLRESRAEPIVKFNAGLAYIGLGKIEQGEGLAEEAIGEVFAGDNLLDGKELLREYADALEHAGYLMMAIQVYHRYDQLSEKLITTVRERALLELSAKFDDERRARELELLRRDNALRVSEMRGQRLRVQIILAGTLFVSCLCAVLFWAFARVRKANQRLLISSERDALTGLHNRRYFNERVLTVDGARPARGCILLADLDHFKTVNDRFGHPAGDAVLATVSERLSAALRASDTLVRWGGEEFLGILEPCPPEQANATVNRLLIAVRRDPVIWNGQLIPCTISIGFGCFPMPGADAEISLEHAVSLVDKALYVAKRRGRDRACLISEVSAHDREDLNSISADFDGAAADHRVELCEIGAAA